MGHMAIWKILEDMVIELYNKGVKVPSDVIADLRSAKSMILLADNEEGDYGEALVKVEEILGKLEANLVMSAQTALGPSVVDSWLKRLETASCNACYSPQQEVAKNQNEKFITGVPRDQKWIRVEPTESLSIERIEQIAKEQNLTIKPENGKLIIYGQPDNIKILVKKMSSELTKK